MKSACRGNNMKFKILEKDYELIKEKLLDSDLENIVFLECKAFKTNNGYIYLVNNVVVPDDKYVVRNKNYVSYGYETYTRVLESCEANNNVFFSVHSHMNSSLDFSNTDNENDQLLLECASVYNPNYFHGSVIMNKEGRISARVLDYKISRFRTIQTIRIIGNNYINYDVNKKVSDINTQDRAIRIFGIEGQKNIESLKVGIVGVGGNGTAVAEQIVRLGIKEILLLDHASISKSNISRMHETSVLDVGKSKSITLKKKLSRIYNDTRITAINDKVWKTESIRQLKECDIIFGCLDNTAKGRVVLDILKNAYYIPYIDMGLKICLSKDKNNFDIYGRVDLLIPGDGCLSCHKAINFNDLNSEMYKGTQLDNEYLIGMDKSVDPQIIPYNTILASASVSLLLEYINHYGRRLTNHYVYNLLDYEILEKKDNELCKICKMDLGKGDELNIDEYIEKD